jgi:hypothetical protein
LVLRLAATPAPIPTWISSSFFRIIALPSFGDPAFEARTTVKASLPATVVREGKLVYDAEVVPARSTVAQAAACASGLRRLKPAPLARFSGVTRWREP